MGRKIWAKTEQRRRIERLVAAKPACYNHNLETVRRLQDPVRRGAKYGRSLDVLRWVKEFDPAIPTKSGLMLGHGESESRNSGGIKETYARLTAIALPWVNILRPSREHLPVQRYWSPEAFEEIG